MKIIFVDLRTMVPIFWPKRISNIELWKIVKSIPIETVNEFG